MEGLKKGLVILGTAGAIATADAMSADAGIIYGPSGPVGHYDNFYFNSPCGYRGYPYGFYGRRYGGFGYWPGRDYFSFEIEWRSPVQQTIVVQEQRPLPRAQPDQRSISETEAERIVARYLEGLGVDYKTNGKLDVDGRSAVADVLLPGFANNGKDVGINLLEPDEPTDYINEVVGSYPYYYEIPIDNPDQLRSDVDKALKESIHKQLNEQLGHAKPSGSDHGLAGFLSRN